MAKFTELDTFTQSYVGTMIWSAPEEDDGTQLDELFPHNDEAWDAFDEDAQREIIEDCKNFQKDYGHLFAPHVVQAGHDFSLTRNRHGAGFWDGDWPKEIGRILTDASHTYGSQYPLHYDGSLSLGS